MPTPPRRWPIELEEERTLSLEEAGAASECLNEALSRLDSARSAIVTNLALTRLLLSEADRCAADTQAHLERIQRALVLSRGKSIHGRWPSVAASQRDDAWGAAQAAATLIASAQEDLATALERLQASPLAAEPAMLEAARKQARALALLERIARLMTEAAMGRA